MSEQIDSGKQGTTRSSAMSTETERPPDRVPHMADSPYLSTYAGRGDSALLDGGRTGGRLAVVVRDLARGAATTSRRHSTDGVTYVVLDGEVELETTGCTRTLRPVTVAHVPVAVAHRYRAVTRARLLVIVVPAGVEQLLAYEERLAQDDPALLLALAQEHHVEFLPGLLP